MSNAKKSLATLGVLAVVIAGGVGGAMMITGASGSEVASEGDTTVYRSETVVDSDTVVGPVMPKGCVMLGEPGDGGVEHCLQVGAEMPKDAVLPDLRIKDLDRCGKEDKEVTNGSCFMIVNPAPANKDYPKLEGRKLLKFPVVTLNVGEGRAEAIADRTAKDSEDWKAYQSFYRPDGTYVSVVIPKVTFYWAGDGHNHWHFKDFDNYWIEDLNGKVLLTAEKHGYCLFDNTSYGPMEGQKNVPTDPLYHYNTTCGQGLPNGITIIQGMSKGWGDTYPIKLADQAIDITGLPDGRYRVGVHADALGAIVESDEGNNEATIEVEIKGDTVTTFPETAQGGLA